MDDRDRDQKLQGGPSLEGEEPIAPQDTGPQQDIGGAPDGGAYGEGQPFAGFAAPENIPENAQQPPENAGTPAGAYAQDGFAGAPQGEGNSLHEEGKEEEKAPYASEKTERQTFAVRMGDAGYVTGRRYDAIKNAFLSYCTQGKKPKRVRARLTSGGETFGAGRNLFAKLCLVGGYLRLFLALDPNAYSQQKYHHKDYTEVVRYAKVPLMIKLSSDRQVKHALELIDDVLTQNGFVKDAAYVPGDQAYIFKKSRRKKTKIVYVERESGAVAAVPYAAGEIAAGMAETREEAEAELVAIDVKLPRFGRVVDREGNKIGKVRGSVWYDLEEKEVGTFQKEEHNVFLYESGARAAYLDQNNNVLTMKDRYVATVRAFRWLPWLLLLIILALVTAFSVLLGAYVMDRSEAPADYAPTLFVADAEGTSWDETENLDVFMNERFGDTVIMPGMDGSYRFTFENRNEHALDFSFAFSEENEYGIGLSYRLKRDGAYIAGAQGYVGAEELSVSGLTIEAASSSVFEIEWLWQHNDAADTAAGENGAVYTLYIEFTAAVRG